MASSKYRQTKITYLPTTHSISIYIRELQKSAELWQSAVGAQSDWGKEENGGWRGSTQQAASLRPDTVTAQFPDPDPNLGAVALAGPQTEKHYGNLHHK